MEIVTGYKAQPHITSAQNGALNASVFGSGSYVATTGNQLAATMITSNICRILCGDIIHQGRHITIENGTYEEVEIANGLQSLKRNDLIVCRYSKNANTGIESVSLVVIQGTSTQGTPSDPAYMQGDILEGDIVSDMPLYRIQLDGITVSEPVKLFTVVKDLNSHANTSASTSIPGHVKFGTTAGTACQGNDSRLSNARTPVSHASSSTTYGVGSTSNYGHVKVTAGNGLAISSGAVSMAAASTSAIGGVKLSSSTSSTSESLAATPKAVKAAYDLADNAIPKANVSIGTKAAVAKSCAAGTTTRILQQSLAAGTYIIYGTLYVNISSKDNGYVDLYMYSGSTKLASVRGFEKELAVKESLDLVTVVTLTETTYIELHVGNGTGSAFTNNEDPYLSGLRWAKIK